MDSIKRINTSQPIIRESSHEKIPRVTYLNEVTQSDNNDDLIELTNNNYITHSEFYKGLTQVGEAFGKDTPASIYRPSTIHPSKNPKQSQLKEKGRRIVQLFPKYVDKSGNKK